jgi:TPR repeat protein
MQGREPMSTLERIAPIHAEMGLAEAAMALARRYEPDELGRLGAIGMQADREAARKWYEKARELGSPDAEAFLRRMGGR